MSLGYNRARGLDVEDKVCEQIPAIPVVDEHESRRDWYDLEFYEAKIECKSCVDQLSSGRRGRWWIAKRNHEKLLDHGGWYAFSVVDSLSEDLLRTALVHVEKVDEFIDGDWWPTDNGGHGVEKYRQITWTAVFGSLEGGSL